MIKVFLIDDHPILLDGLKSILNAEGNGMKLVGSATGCNDGINAIKHDPVDVLLLDLLMPAMSGIDCIPFLKRIAPPLKIIALTGETDAALLARAWKAGVQGILIKTTGKEDLLNVIRGVMKGQRIIGEGVPAFFDTAIAGDIGNAPTLTKREMEVLNLLALGDKRSEVADKLNLSLDAINFHCRNLFKKFNKKKLQAVLREARKRKLIS